MIHRRGSSGYSKVNETSPGLFAWIQTKRAHDGQVPPNFSYSSPFSSPPPPKLPFKSIAHFLCTHYNTAGNVIGEVGGLIPKNNLPNWVDIDLNLEIICFFIIGSYQLVLHDIKQRCHGEFFDGKHIQYYPWCQGNARSGNGWSWHLSSKLSQTRWVGPKFSFILPCLQISINLVSKLHIPNLHKLNRCSVVCSTTPSP